MKNYEVGNRQNLGIHVEINPKDLEIGVISIYVDGSKFSNLDFEENVKDFLERINEYLSHVSGDYPLLFKMNALEFFDYISCGHGESYEIHKCDKFREINKIYNFNEVDSNLVIRAEYAFDPIFVAVIPNGSREKIVAKYYDSSECSSVVINRGDLSALFSKLQEIILETNK